MHISTSRKMDRRRPPTEANRYVFLGDICDRGDFCVDFDTAVGFRIGPTSVTILRGNHEKGALCDRPIRAGGGFTEMCQQRYPVLPGWSALFQKLFIQLPLFAVLVRLCFVGRNQKLFMQIADLLLALERRGPPTCHCLPCW